MVDLAARAIQANKELVHDPVITFRQANWAQIAFGTILMLLSVLLVCLIVKGDLVLSFGSVIFTSIVWLLGIIALRLTKKMVLKIDRENCKLTCSKSSVLGTYEKKTTIPFQGIKDIEIIRRIRGSSSFQQVSYHIKLILTKQCGLVSSKLLVY